MRRLLPHIKAMLSGRYGTVSAARVLMVLFSFLTMGILIAVFRHMIKLTDPTLLGLWIGSLPSIGGVLIGFISTPYAVSKAAGSASELWSTITALRKRDG